jgi:hypothetical protein
MIDYADKPVEAYQNPSAKGMIERITCGNTDARVFLWRFWCFMHAFDDLIDRDKPVSADEAIRELVLFLQEISFNPFYNAHKGSLFGFIAMVANRAIVGEQWKAGTDEQKMASASVRCGDLDLYSHIAFLCGGWDHMRNLDPEIRVIDKE